MTKEASQEIRADELYVDLREPYVFECGTIPGSCNIPLSHLDQLYSLPQDRRICVFCQAGEVSQEIAELLLDAGYDAYSLEGGYRRYLQNRVAADFRRQQEKEQMEQKEQEERQAPDGSDDLNFCG